MKTSLATLLAIVAVLGTYAEEAAPQPATAQDPAAMLTPEETAPAPQSEESKAPAAEEKANEAPDDTGVPVPVQPNEQKAAATAAAAAAAQQPLREEDTDEIDLEEVDDSAEAAKKPQINVSDENVEFVDISCDEATLADILRQFRKTTRANILHDDSTNLQKRVSAELRHVPWLDALQSILKSRDFRLEQRGDIYLVMEEPKTIPILTKTFRLNHASSEELANLFNANYAKKDNQGKVLQNVATAFVSANTVVVTGPEKVIADCEAIVKAVDRAVPQIYIEARFIELTTEAMHSLGLDWSTLKSWGASVNELSGSMGFGVDKAVTLNKDGSISISEDRNGAHTVRHSGSTDLSTADDTFSHSTKTDSTRTRNSKREGSSVRGFSGTLSVDDFRLALSAFENLSDAKIFSNPKVIVSNGKEAKVDMTTKYPYIELTSQRNTQNDNAYLDYSAKLQQIPGDKETGLFAGSAFFSYGIELSVKPRIAPDGLISVDITPSISYVDEFYSVSNGSGDGADSSYGKFPIVKMKSISTEFSMKDGSTAVIGGLSKTEEEDVDDGIPYLRKLPWIGPKLFGSKRRQNVQYEIIVCVTVGIANPEDLPKDIGLPKNAVLGREYVEGKRLEPGDRRGSAAAALAIDLDSLEKQQEKREQAFAEKQAAVVGRGTVTVTPSAEQ